MNESRLSESEAEKAFDSLVKVLEIDNKHRHSYLLISELDYLSDKSDRKRFDLLGRAKRDMPKDADIWAAYGLCAHGLGRSNDDSLDDDRGQSIARQSYEKALSLDPNCKRAYLELIGLHSNSHGAIKGQIGNYLLHGNAQEDKTKASQYKREYQKRFK